MEYLQLKHSVEQLTECLKIIPKEDKKIIKDLINKYNIKLSSINYLDENNDFFDGKEQRHINQFLSCLRQKILKPYEDKRSEIEDKISLDSGLTEADKKYDEIWSKIDRIAKNYCEKNFSSWNHTNETKIARKIKEKSKVYKNIEKELHKKYDEYDNLLDQSKEFKKAQSSIEKIKYLLDNFDLDLNIKNMIAYRSRNMESKSITSTAGNTIREIISTEIEKQWLTFFEKSTNY